MVFIVQNHVYIMEMKTMKSVGGGQDKQINEVIDFIRHAEKSPSIHYVVFLDGDYSNLLHNSSRAPKVRRQYQDILNCLKNHPGNYFLNTAGFQKLIAQLLNK